MPLMYPPRPKGRAVNHHVSRVPEMLARGWSFEPVDEGQRVEPPQKLTAAEREELRALLGAELAEMEKLTGDQRAAIRAGATYEPPAAKASADRSKPKRKQRKDTT